MVLRASVSESVEEIGRPEMRAKRVVRVSVRRS
jgi:hypothetical protein